MTKTTTTTTLKRIVQTNKSVLVSVKMYEDGNTN